MSSDSTLPPDAFQGGYDIDGSKIYIGRAMHEGYQIIAKVIPSKQAAYVAWDGKEHSIHQFEVGLFFFTNKFWIFFDTSTKWGQVLCGSRLRWVGDASGHVPRAAIPCGDQADDEKLFIGRIHIKGSLTPGYIRPLHHCIYIPFHGVEFSQVYYEVLVPCLKRKQILKFLCFNICKVNLFHKLFGCQQMIPVLHCRRVLF